MKIFKKCFNNKNINLDLHKYSNNKSPYTKSYFLFYNII